MPAMKILIGERKKAFCMASSGHFPADQEQGGQRTETPGIEASYCKQRRTQHHKIPVIDPAGGTAAVLHPDPLKWAVEQDTNDIAYGIGGTEQEQDPVIKCPNSVQNKNQSVSQAPD